MGIITKNVKGFTYTLSGKGEDIQHQSCRETILWSFFIILNPEDTLEYRQMNKTM